MNRVDAVKPDTEDAKPSRVPTNLTASVSSSPLPKPLMGKDNKIVKPQSGVRGGNNANGS